MANKNLFKSLAGKLTPAADARNEENAPAYALTPKQALAQYAAYTRAEIDMLLILTVGVRVMSLLETEMITFRTTEEVLALVRRFDDCTLPRKEWTHAAHLTVALRHLLQYDWPEAVARMRLGIQRYNAANGIPTTTMGSYHETLTLFWMRHVRSFLEDGRNEARSLVALANDLADSADRNLPLAYYTRERLFSTEARASWVEPDLKRLD
jgi:hypothetical protein